MSPVLFQLFDTHPNMPMEPLYLYKYGQSSSVIATAKTGVAPVGAMNVPRLKLMGAVCRIKLTRRLPKTVGQTVKTCFGGHVPQVEDLCHSSPTDLPKFKGQRSSEQWRHISTDENPAILELRI